MTGLIIKDFLILRKSLRAYLGIMAVYMALTFTGAWSVEFLGSFLMVLVAMLPMNVFAYDKQAKWDVYGLALPINRTKTVAARYMAVLLLCLFSIILVTVVGVVLAAMGRIEEPDSYVFTCAILGLLAVVMNAVLLPFLYRFGPERARLMLIGLFGLLALAGWLFLIPLGGIDWLKTLGEPSPSQIAAMPILAVAAGLILLALSFLASRYFYGKRDI